MNTINRLLFYIAWVVYLVYYVLFNCSSYKLLIDADRNESLVKYTTVGLLFISSMFISRYNAKSIMMFLLILSIFLISSMKSHSQMMLLMILFSYAAKDNISIEEFIKIDLFLRILLVLIVILSVYFGVIQNQKVEINGYEKNTFGFNHVNTLGVLIGTIFSEYIALNFKKINLVRIIVLSMGIFCMYHIGISRTAIFSMLLIVFLIPIVKMKMVSEIIEHHSILFSLIPLMMWLVCAFLAIRYDSGNAFMKSLDSVLSTRLHWAHYFCNQYGFSLFGRKIILISTQQAAQLGIQAKIFDMGFVRLGVEYGVLVMAAFLLFFTLICKYSIDTKNFGLFLAVIYFSLTLCVEVGAYNVINNFTLIFAVQGVLNCGFISRKKYRNLVLKKRVQNLYNRFDRVG